MYHLVALCIADIDFYNIWMRNTQHAGFDGKTATVLSEFRGSDEHFYGIGNARHIYCDLIAQNHYFRVKQPTDVSLDGLPMCSEDRLFFRI